MKKILCFLLIAMFILAPFAPVAVNADEGVTVHVVLEVDPRIEASGAPVMVGFINVDTGKEIGVSITKDTNYWGEIKNVPAGTYSLVKGAVGSDWDGVYEFPFWTEYIVDGISTQWHIKIGDVNYDGPVDTPDEDEIKDPGFVDYEEMYGMTYEEYQEYLKGLETTTPDEETDFSVLENYHKVILDGELTAEDIILSFNDGTDNRTITFSLENDYTAETILEEGTYTISFIRGNKNFEYKVITNEITVKDDKSDILISVSEGSSKPSNPSEPEDNEQDVTTPTTPGGEENPSDNENGSPNILTYIFLIGGTVAIVGILYWKRKKKNSQE